uniref:Piscidin-4 n=1 Tax=Amphilophus citrinellus TaxID=61819 RepID=A0A3Q0RYQ3_AMPCI
MKCTVLFLVLSMVVLMAEPGDAFIHHIISGIVHGGNKEQQLEQQQELNERLFNREQLKQERAAFNERV